MSRLSYLLIAIDLFATVSSLTYVIYTHEARRCEPALVADRRVV